MGNELVDLIPLLRCFLQLEYLFKYGTYLLVILQVFDKRAFVHDQPRLPVLL